MAVRAEESDAWAAAAARRSEGGDTRRADTGEGAGAGEGQGEGETRRGTEIRAFGCETARGRRFEILEPPVISGMSGTPALGAASPTKGMVD